MLVKAESFMVMYYVTLGDMTWNLSLIVFCVFSVAAVHGLSNAILMSENLLTFEGHRGWQIFNRIVFCEAVVATVFLAIPKANDIAAPIDMFFAYIVAIFGIAIGYIVVYLAAVIVTIIIKWIFGK